LYQTFTTTDPAAGVNSVDFQFPDMWFEVMNVKFNMLASATAANRRVRLMFSTVQAGAGSPPFLGVIPVARAQQASENWEYEMDSRWPGPENVGSLISYSPLAAGLVMPPLSWVRFQWDAGFQAGDNMTAAIITVMQVPNPVR
jgi:hypothetical protein